MGKCIICGKDCAGECCSGACRAKKSRRTPNHAHAHVMERTVEAHVELKRKPKRGKDIKCFEDLHPEIQATIERTSKDKDDKIDEAEKGRRTAIAVNYQHLYPDRCEPRSDLKFTSLMATAGLGYVRVSKPGDPDYDGLCTPEWISQRRCQRQ